MFYLADYQSECSKCGESPCVVVRNPEPTGARLHDTELCGVHFFRDRRMVHPEDWNIPQEDTE